MRGRKLLGPRSLELVVLVLWLILLVSVVLPWIQSQ